MIHGIYIHIPFCVEKCYYCDFYSVTSSELMNEYFIRLKKEIKCYEKYGRIKADSVFFGGGTPSYVNERFICETLDEINRVFDLQPDTEITIEANPATFDEKKLISYKKNGINRISIGLQSANNDELKKIGRIHTKESFENAYNLIKKVGFDNVNVDIIYGLMNSNVNTLSKTAQYVKSLNTQHISAYALTLCENTPIYSMGYTYPDDDNVFEQYELLCSMFSEYRHYEISNFAKRPCIHNLKYWTREPYIGLGAAAHSFFMNKRFYNTADISAYIKNDDIIKDSLEIKGIDEINEYIMLSLRTDIGINLKYLKEKYNLVITDKKQNYINMLYENGYIKKTSDGFSLTQDGFFVSNSIISELLIDKP